MLLKLAPLLIGFLAAYLVRGKAINAHLAAKRPFRAFWVWLKAAIIAVPVAAILLAAIVLLRESGLLG
jgi:hypothetical protein